MSGEFSDIYISEQYSDVKSRTYVDVSNDIGPIRLDLPVISANMPQITETAMAMCMRENGCLGILHRFCSVEENCSMLQMTRPTKDGTSSSPIYDVGVSIGVKDEEKKRFDALYGSGARLFCVDVAMGNHVRVKDMLTWIREKNLKDVFVIAGNVSTGDGACNLAEWGANVVKVGIGPGECCTTRKRTGVGTPQFRAIRDVRNNLNATGRNNVAVIADGGIKNTSDIVKAMIYADGVMVGSVLAGTIETPGKVYPCPDTDLYNRTYYKVFGGSASAENKNIHGQAGQFVEGKLVTVPFKGHAKYILREIKEGMQSAYSYCGASNTREFKSQVHYHERNDL